MKLKGSTKIALAFVALIVVAYFGYDFVSGRMIDSKKFGPIGPGRVTLVGIRPGAGFQIKVSNDIAQLVEASDKFEAGSMNETGGDSSDKRQIPLREMLESLKGNEVALGKVVTQMNDDLRKADLPTVTIRWEASDIRKALDGDKVLRAKLEKDLNVDLTGMPLETISLNALYSGIVIHLPVQVNVDVMGQPKTLVAMVDVPYRAAFTRKVEMDLQDKGLNPSDEVIRGYYMQERNKVLKDPGNRENVAKALENRISKTVADSYAASASRVLGDTRVILNENFIENAAKGENPNLQGKPMYDLVINLSDEGRDRLWQYSRSRVGTQLLLTVDGIAIAAPHVSHELAQKNLVITQMPDESLVQDAVDLINKSNKTAKK